ncbi:MAG: hypothetical protein AAGJ35_03040 [Myxococcota bacterium]
MSLAESEAAFEQHAKRIDSSGDLFNLLKGAGITCLSALAFAAGAPQSPLSEEGFKDFVTALNNDADPSIKLLSGMKRLHFEASAIVLAELKAKTTSDTLGGTIRKLPAADKAARLREQEARLNGLQIRGELQPSYALIDLVAGILENDCIVWIPPSKCSKRDAEIQNTMKEKPAVLSLEQQLVKVAASEPAVVVDTSTDLQLQWALQRRGLAFDQCALISHAEHEIWVQQLLGQLTRDAPAGYAKVTTTQLIKADCELFTIMARELRGSLQPVQSKSPMEEALKRLRTDPRVTMHLLPLARAAGNVDKTSSSAIKPVKQNMPAASSQNRPAKKPKTSAKAKSLCPEELRGYVQRDASGQAICWSFNMKNGCKETVTNGRCKKGQHCCIKCHRTNHSLVTCRSNAS